MLDVIVAAEVVRKQCNSKVRFFFEVLVVSLSLPPLLILVACISVKVITTFRIVRHF